MLLSFIEAFELKYVCFSKYYTEGGIQQSLFLQII